MPRKVKALCLAVCLCVLAAPRASVAPIMVDNATAEILPKGKWDIEFHYGYYPMTRVKETAFWGYAAGDATMLRMNDHNVRYVNQVWLTEAYYAFSDELLVGGIIPYTARDVRKQFFLGHEDVFSDGIGDCALRGCLNLLDPAKEFFGAAIGGAILFPTGSEDKDPPTGNGRYEFTMAMVFTKHCTDRLKTHVTLCYTLPTRNRGYRYWNMYSEVRPGNEFHYGVVAEYAAMERINLLFEVNGYVAPESRDRDDRKIPYTGYNKVDLVPGIQFKLNTTVTLEAALQVTVKRGRDFDYDVAPVFGAVMVF